MKRPDGGIVGRNVVAHDERRGDAVRKSVVLEEFLRTVAWEDNGLPLASLLVKAELVPKEIVEEETRIHIFNVVRHALEWDHGKFVFRSCDFNKKNSVLEHGVPVKSVLIAHVRGDEDPETETLASKMDSLLFAHVQCDKDPETETLVRCDEDPETETLVLKIEEELQQFLP